MTISGTASTPQLHFMDSTEMTPNPSGTAGIMATFATKTSFTPTPLLKQKIRG